ncbi:MAG: response regulator [Thermomicrobiales bacterium]|nr:response regulator [Thermomicrobiales bacterium]
MPTHVMVINDTPEILDLFQQLLGDEGYRVTVDRFSEAPAELLARVKADCPDLLILDFLIGRDEEKGWQFLQLLKMDRSTRAIPIIVCTGAVVRARDLRTHLDAMGVAVVLKPFNIDHLLAVIVSMLAGATTTIASDSPCE